MTKADVLSISVTTGGYNQFLKEITEAALRRKSKYACMANVHMLVEGHYDRAFGRVVSNADFIAPDGMPLTWAMKLLYGIKQDRVAGMDLLPDLLQQAEKRALPVFFYGGTTEMLEKTEIYLQKRFPALQVAGLYSPPFRDLQQAEEDSIVEMINNSNAAFVFVVLGCPKQEKWIASMKGRINAMMVAVGGALPVMIGMQKRAPKWMQKSGLEWFYRLYQEPKRLFKRYAVTNVMFLMLLFKGLIKKTSIKPLGTKLNYE